VAGRGLPGESVPGRRQAGTGAAGPLRFDYQLKVTVPRARRAMRSPPNASKCSLSAALATLMPSCT